MISAIVTIIIMMTMMMMNIITITRCDGQLFWGSTCREGFGRCSRWCLAGCRHPHHHHHWDHHHHHYDYWFQQEHVDMINKSGLRIIGEGGDRWTNYCHHHQYHCRHHDLHHHHYHHHIHHINHCDHDFLYQVTRFVKVRATSKPADEKPVDVVFVQVSSPNL